ncbi:MAG: hypothetical protein QNJ98_01530 [Planctomycetota bacterium]|nr:hypothetical protein [Planctomycetota bacterium]
MTCALLTAILSLGGCGNGDGDAPGGQAKPVRPIATVAAAQEVWIPFHDPSHRKGGANNPRGLYTPPPPGITRERAKALAEAALEQARQGLGIGHLAWANSSAPWGRLGGYTGLLPASRPPDARDKAVLACEVGALTPLIEWRKGYWFAQRIDDAQADRLQQRARSANRVRARARVIHVHHKGAWPQRFEFKKTTREMALEIARGIIAKVQAGADFETLAREGLNNAVRLKQTGGLLVDKGSEWVTWRTQAWGYELLEAILEDAPVGQVMPEPVVGHRGVEVVFVLERRFQ